MSRIDFKRHLREALIECWIETIRSAPPRKLRSPMMAKILTCEDQWHTSGKPRAANARKLRRLASASPDTAAPGSNGQRSVREWNGVQHTVGITEAGYLWNGKTSRSLSAIAKEITGTKWSGPRFFGVQTRKKSAASFTPEKPLTKTLTRLSTRWTRSVRPARPIYARSATEDGSSCRSTMMMAGYPVGPWIALA